MIQHLSELNSKQIKNLNDLYQENIQIIKNAIKLTPASKDEVSSKALSYLIHIKNLKSEEAIQHLSELSPSQINDLEEEYEKNIRAIESAIRMTTVSKEEKTATTPSADLDGAGSKMPLNKVASLVADVCGDGPLYAAKAAARTPNVSAAPVPPSPTPK